MSFHQNHIPHTPTIPVHVVHVHVPGRLLALVRYRRRIATGVMVMVLFSVAAQLLYPAERMLPFASLAGNGIGLQSAHQVAGTLDRINEQEISVRAAKQTYQPSLSEIGINFESQKSAEMITQYPTASRLIPFSAFFYGRGRDYESMVKAKVDEVKLQEFAEQVAAENSYSATEGAIYIEKSKVVVEPPKNGAAYSAVEVLDTLKSLGVRIPDAMVLPSETVKPAISHAALKVVADEAQSILAQPFVMSAAGKDHAVAADTVASWMSFAPNLEARQVDIQYDVAAIKVEISNFARSVNQAAGTTVITTIDSNEISRVSGTAGKYLNADKAAEAIIANFQSGASRVDLNLDPLLPGTTYKRSYTSTSIGLQALLNEWSKDHPGISLAVSFKEIGGKGRQAALNGDDPYFAASMYKLYIAHYLLYQIQVGQLQPSAQLGIARSVDSCIESMIVVSTNSCPTAIAGAVGWNTMHNFAVNSGFTNTSLKNGNNEVTAHDTANFLTKLYHGQLLNAENTDRFMGMLKRQQYRQAIPAGSRGAAVADKVGIYGGYWHDGGIVYHPKTTYVLVILTNGGSAASIADLSGKIYDVINQ